MRTVALAIIAATLALGGCATEMQHAILNDIQHCKRHYTVQGGTGGTGLSGPTMTFSGDMACDPLPAAPAAPVSLTLTPSAAALADPIGAAILNPPT